MNRFSQPFLAFFLLIFSLAETSATHIRGGQISYRIVDGSTVEFTFSGYRDVNGVTFGQGRFDFGDGHIFGDDAEEAIEWTIVENLNNGIEKWKFTFVHQYAANGEYLVSYTEDFRNANSKNIGGSVSTPFHVEAFVVLDPLIGGNSSPKNKFQPNFFAISGHPLLANLSMIDEDGDSLSYRIQPPLQGKDSEVSGYLIPADPSFYSLGGEATFKIDPFSSNLVWDAPGELGGYSIAIKTEEWRKIDGSYRFMGFTVLDYEIAVVAAEGFYSISIPASDCRSSLDNYQDKIVVGNPTEEELSIEFCSGIEGLKFNGLSWSEWNETFKETKFSDPEINIDVTLSKEMAQNLTGLNSVVFEINGRHMVSVESGDPFEQDISTISGFNIGIDCDLDKLILSSAEEKDQTSVSFSRTHIKVLSDSPSEGWLSIYDVRGNLLLDVNRPLKQGTNTIDFDFELQTPYFIILHHKKGTITEKVLLTK